jgi:excisionase family DNA binding protein
MEIPDTGDTPKILFTIDEVAAYLKVPKCWLYNRTRRGHPDPVPVIRAGRHLRFDLAAVLNHLKAK